MSVNSLVPLMRKSQGITQGEAVSGIGIKKASLSAYELGKFKLSDEYLSKICDKLGIDIEYAKGKPGTYPFKRDGQFYRLAFGKDTVSGEPDLEVLYVLMGFNSKLDMISLTSGDFGGAAARRVHFFQIPVCAIAFRDEIGNIFIMRKNPKARSVMFAEDVKIAIERTLKISGRETKGVNFCSQEITRDLQNKIEKETVAKDDIGGLFNTARFVPLMELSKEEANMLCFIRRSGVPLSAIEQYTTQWRKNSHDQR